MRENKRRKLMVAISLAVVAGSMVLYFTVGFSNEDLRLAIQWVMAAGVFIAVFAAMPPAKKGPRRKRK